MNRIHRRFGPLTAAVSTLALTAALSAGALMAPSFAERPIAVEPMIDGAMPSLAPLIERVSPAVVSINVTVESAGPSFDGDFDFRGVPDDWRQFFDEFRRHMEPLEREGRSLGSGFFISADGHIVTNNHVVDNGTEITVVLDDGEEYVAEVLGTDPSTDLAVLKVDGDEPFPFVEFAADVRPRVGDWVIAVGNPFGLGGTATVGIVSATGRDVANSTYNDFIQTDASINRGNSGGPTFDMAGRVIGVNSQIYSPTGGNVGIGFAIPADVAEKVTNSLIDNGRVVRGWLGVTIQSINEEIAGGMGLDTAQGALVARIVEDSPADDAGFKEQDIVLALNGEDVEDATDLTRKVGDLEAGSRARFDILREGRTRKLTVKIGERPDEDALRNGSPSSSSGSGDADVLGMDLRRPNASDRSRLGLDDETKAVIIADVDTRSVAFEQGLRAGQAILKVDSTEIGSVSDFRDALEEAREAMKRDTKKSGVLVLVLEPAGQRYLGLPLEDEDE